MVRIINTRRIDMKVKLIVFLIVVILFLILIVQNTEVVTLKVFFWEISMSQAILFLLIFVLGMISGWVSCVVYKRKR